MKSVAAQKLFRQATVSIDNRAETRTARLHHQLLATRRVNAISRSTPDRTHELPPGDSRIVKLWHRGPRSSALQRVPTLQQIKSDHFIEHFIVKNADATLASGVNWNVLTCCRLANAKVPYSNNGWCVEESEQQYSDRLFGNDGVVSRIKSAALDVEATYVTLQECPSSAKPGIGTRFLKRLQDLFPAERYSVHATGELITIVRGQASVVDLSTLGVSLQRQRTDDKVQHVLVVVHDATRRVLINVHLSYDVVDTAAGRAATERTHEEMSALTKALRAKYPGYDVTLVGDTNRVKNAERDPKAASIDALAKAIGAAVGEFGSCTNLVSKDNITVPTQADYLLNMPGTP